MRIVPVESKTAKLIINPRRVEVKLPDDWNSSERGIVLRFFEAIVADLKPKIGKTWRGSCVRPPSKSFPIFVIMATDKRDQMIKYSRNENVLVQTPLEPKCKS